MTIRRAAIALAVVAALAAGCSHVIFGPDYSLTVSNSTTIPVTLVLNEQPVSVIEPGNSIMIHAGDLPARPWTVELTTDGGRSLIELAVAEGSVVDERALDGTGSYGAPAARADLSCGQVRVWVGQVMPGGPAPGPGVPGDCDP
jgi:hypothetical protein